MGALLVPSGDAAKLLETANETLDTVAAAIRLMVEGTQVALTGGGWNDGADATLPVSVNIVVA